jgi:hypothetical protein
MVINKTIMQQLGMTVPSSYVSYMTARVYIESRGRRIKRTGRWFEVVYQGRDVVCDWSGIIDMADRLRQGEAK